MVRISEELEGDPTERLNLDDYKSDDFDEYLSDNMETTLPTITEAQATTKQDPLAPPPAVTVTVQLEEQHPAEDLYERRRLLNQKRAFRRQRLANNQQEQQGDNYDYSNCDLRNVINIGRDARNVIISRRKEREEIEAYSSSFNYLIPANASASFKKHKPASTRPQGKPRTPHQQNIPTQVLCAPQELSYNLRVQLTPQGPWGTTPKGDLTNNLVDQCID